MQSRPSSAGLLSLQLMYLGNREDDFHEKVHQLLGTGFTQADLYAACTDDGMKRWLDRVLKPRKRGLLDKLLNRSDTKPQPSAVAAMQPRKNYINDYGHEVSELYEFVDSKVAGVTFCNNRRKRQTILRAIRWKDPPYHKDVSVWLKMSEYKGEPAIQVWANEEQIGFVPKSELPFYVNNWDRYHDSYDLEVYGGGTTSSGEAISYGAQFRSRFEV